MSRLRRGGPLVALLLALAATVVPATTVDWRNAGSHVGERVSVEGDVAAARVENNTCLLEFDTADTGALRVRLLLPMVSSLPPHPERLYLGKRVVVTGKVRRFLGKLEMVVNSPGAIEVMGVAGGPASPPGVAETAPAAAPDTAARAPARVVSAPDSRPPLVAPPPAPGEPATERATSGTSGDGAAAAADTAPTAAPDHAAPARQPYPDQPTTPQPPPETGRLPERAALEHEPTTLDRPDADREPAPPETEPARLEREPAPTPQPAAPEPAALDDEPRREPTALERDTAAIEPAPAPSPTGEPVAPSADALRTAPEPDLDDAPAAAPLLAVVDPCRRARDHWSAASYTLRERMDTLARCLDAESYACRASAAALAPALTDLEWAEQRVEAACPR